MVPIEFTGQCLISSLPAFVHVPSNIAGHPVTPPRIPKVPGLTSIAGFEEILVKFATEGIVPGKLAPGS